MEVPRNWRIRSWRYALRVEVCDDCGRVQNECPTGVRDFVEAGGLDAAPNEVMALPTIKAMENVSNE